ncbi:MAG: CoA transferase [Betaproteobacteria bacterium]|nr:MAG: CoA transferase [Betaproteobacteria bacterium]
MRRLPLEGVRVVEFAHMVMGPTCGLVLADLGAEVIKVEPLEGDNTRRLMGAGAGFYPIFNRNKQSLAVDLKSASGREIVLRLIDTADAVTENFRPGALERMGLGYEALSQRNPRLVYCTLKGFLSGPYENRPALDEVVQMMGGLAYMTGLPDRPLRVGSSVNDIMGGMFGAIGILAALRERESTGRGKLVRSALFENTVFLVAQHMAQLAITGEEPPPMAVKKPAWGVYDIFETADDRLFVGVVTDTQWDVFCREFGEAELAADRRLRANSQRVAERAWLIPHLAGLFRRYRRAELEQKLEAIGLPYAPITRPRELFDDPHLNAGAGMIETRDPRGYAFKVPGLPLELDGERLAQRSAPPGVGEGAREILSALGYGTAEIEALAATGVLALP